MEITVLQSQQPHDLHFETGLFKYLFLGIAFESLVYIDPPSGERPCTVALLDQQNFPRLENRRRVSSLGV